MRKTSFDPAVMRKASSDTPKERKASLEHKEGLLKCHREVCLLKTTSWKKASSSPTKRHNASATSLERMALAISDAAKERKVF